MNIENVKRGAKMVQEGFNILGRGPFNWYLEELVAAYDLMMARCCPYRVGDRVRLVRAPDFDNAPNWKSCSHFLIPGALATVTGAQCGSRGFEFYVEFDDESWIDRDGVRQQPTEKSSFAFGEGCLSLAREQS